MNSTDIYCCENFWVIFYQHEVLIAMVCFGDNVYSFSWKFISQKRNPKKKTKTCYKNEKACWEIKQSEKVFNLISLFLPAMGGISPYKYVTWQQPVGIGLTLQAKLNLRKRKTWFREIQIPHYKCFNPFLDNKINNTADKTAMNI